MTWVRLLFYGSLEFMNAISGLKEGSRRDRKELGEGKEKKKKKAFYFYGYLVKIGRKWENKK